ncbi:MAG: NAD(P)H-hydrate dehydratase [Armatimonadetes bacterium]|nr:NAD(P)H-hydrate dehydratase [Armatimonadota bacterium]
MKACTAAEMRDIDRRATAEYGIPSLMLMENAGRAVAEVVRERLPRRDARVAVVCGRGNNGGDGFVAARHLWNEGRPVTVWLTVEAERVQGDALVNLEIVRRLGMPLQICPHAAPAQLEADLVVDALYGTGLKGEIRGVGAEFITAIEKAGAPVVAVDIPSGLDADTGTWANACVRAEVTVTFGLPKVGLLVWPGRGRVGDLRVADISLPPPLLSQETLRHEWIDASAVAPRLPRRRPEAHKGDAGRVFVLAGSVGLTGAATLAAGGALRGGAGLVTLGIPRSLNDILETKVTEVMTLPLPETPSRALSGSTEAMDAIRAGTRSADALALGPGLGRDPATGALVRALLGEWNRPLVVDADGLNLVAPADERTFPPQAVVTPHPGELARLLGTAIEEVQSNRLDSARRAAARFGCVVVLKGAATLVAAPDGRLAINSSGTPALATGGTGDVLTGLIAALLGQGLAPFDAAAAGVFIHGLAGELAAAEVGGVGMAAGDMLACIPRALRLVAEGIRAP